MKYVLRFFTLLICFELMLSPLKVEIINSTVAHAQKSCPTGQQYDSSLNRCLTSAQVIQVNNATQSCKNLGSAEEEQKCYAQNAQTALSDAVNASDDDDLKSKDSFFKDEKGTISTGAQIGNAAAIAVPLFLLTKVMFDKAKVNKAAKAAGATGKNPSGFRCRPASLMLMYGAAGVLATSEVITWIKHKDHLETLDNKWKDIQTVDRSTSKDAQQAKATEAQSQAFTLMAENERSVADVAKTKKTFYGTATGLFAAGSLMAAWEMMQLAAAKKVPPVIGTSPNPQYPVAQQKIQRLTCGSQGRSEEDNKKYDEAEKEENKKKEEEKAKSESTSGSSTGGSSTGGSSTGGSSTGGSSTGGSSTGGSSTGGSSTGGSSTGGSSTGGSSTGGSSTGGSSTGGSTGGKAGSTTGGSSTGGSSTGGSSTGGSSTGGSSTGGSSTGGSSTGGSSTGGSSTGGSSTGGSSTGGSTGGKSGSTTGGSSTGGSSTGGSTGGKSGSTTGGSSTGGSSTGGATTTTGGTSGDAKKVGNATTGGTAGGSTTGGATTTTGGTSGDSKKVGNATTGGTAGGTDAKEPKKELTGIDKLRAVLDDPQNDLATHKARCATLLGHSALKGKKVIKYEATGMNQSSRVTNSGNVTTTTTGGSVTCTFTVVDENKNLDVINISTGLGGTTGSVDNKKIQEILNFKTHQGKYKAREIALKNIETAQDTEQLLQLIQEYESIEFENYSKVSYFNDELKGFEKQPLTSSVSKLIAQMFMESAHANTIYDPTLDPDYDPTQNNPPAEEEKSDKKKKGKKDDNGEEPKKDPVKSAQDIGKVMKLIQGTLKFGNGKVLTSNELKMIENQMNSKFNKFIYSPTTRFAINGVLGGWMGIMTHHMAKQQKLSEARAEKLDQMSSEFNAGAGLMYCKPEERNDPSKPRCYCFTEDNKKNPARAKSKICNTEYANFDKNRPQNYGGNSKVCVDENYQVDQACSCRNRKGSDGKNACLKSTAGIDFKGINPGVFRMLSAGAGPANDLFGGNTAVGNMDTGSMSANAAKIRNAAEDLAKKAGPTALKDSKKLGKGMESSLLASTSGLRMSGLGGGSASLPSSPKEAAAELTKELAKEEAPVVNAAGMSGGAGAGQAPAEPELEFGMTEEQLAEQESEIAEVMNENLDMGNSDINNSSDTNLFDVLSNRYKRSGMRRLFDEDGKTKADVPSNTDITE
jgi:hypothetical protein